MYHMLHAKHKMTTERQYSVLKSNMAVFLQNNKNNNNNPTGILKYKQNHIYWTELTEKLNKLGPPYRTIQEWKKVWCDFKRAERKRKAKSKLKLQHVKNESVYNNEVSPEETQDTFLETATTNELDIHIKSESQDNEHNSQSVYSTYSNEYDNDYSYPDENSLQGSYMDESVTPTHAESSRSSNTYSLHYLNDSSVKKSVDHSSVNKSFSAPPPLQPANLLMQNQTLYALQNQMQHQTKLLEHLSQMSSTMAGLMERQVDAVEKQTEAMHRQALATEKHTSVMNKFIDMIREKMLKGNSHKRTDSTDNSSDDML